MKQISSIFHFSEKYRHYLTFSEQEVTVKLEIDYTSKTYSIIPVYGSVDSFSFINNSKEYRAWQAILIAIDKAIRFANEEIGVSDRPAKNEAAC